MTVDQLSYSATANGDPNPFYDRARKSDVVWDDKMNAWLVLSYGAIREVMRQDKKLVRQPVSDIPDETLHLISGGKRSRGLLHGEDHARHHRWFVHHFSYGVVDQWRETLLRPIAERLLDPMVAGGKLDVLEDYADKFSIRVIAAILGLPWEDDDWIAHCKHLLDRKMAYLDLYFAGVPPEIEKSAVAAVEEMNELILPFVLAAKEREPREDDIVALLWAEGTTIMPDWGLEDMRAWVTDAFFAGTDTTTHALINATYLLATSSSLQDEVRNGDRDTVERFAEEVLRLFPSAHFTRRMANQDFELAGMKIKKDDRMLMLDAAANRDQDRYPCPHAVDLEREGSRDHLAFSVGPRTCSGAALARAEIQEATSTMLARLSNIRLDPAAPEPTLHGFLFRSYQPLHILFDPS
jgi:cytochrome P450